MNFNSFSVIVTFTMLLTGAKSFAQIDTRVVDPHANIVTANIIASAGTPRTQRGANVFNTKFNALAVGRNDVNAYLLSYLSTAIYADKILEIESPTRPPSELAARGDDLQVNSRAFQSKFKQVISPYFSATTAYNGESMEYFEETGNFDGYDPEAMIIPADNAIFVVFRGTDRVAQYNNQGSLLYNVREWVQTDFQAFLTRPPLPQGKSFTGKVHQGMWLSVAKIAERMAGRIAALGGADKKVWITGHSLGAGQAQLFAYYLAKVYNIKAQGVYAYAAPQVGNTEFYNDLVAQLGGTSKLQRFEFMDDPVTGFALNVPDFGKGGTRVFYNVLARETFGADERSSGEIIRMSLSTGAVIAHLGGMCYHTQNWYMQGALKQLSPALAAQLPLSLPVPNLTFTACESGLDISRALNENPVVEAGLDLVDALLEEVSRAVSDNLNKLSNDFKNYAGSALKNGEGKYRIKCLESGRYLNVKGSCYTGNGCRVLLWEKTANDANELFRVEKYGLGYGIRISGENKVLDVKDLSTSNNALVQTWEKHGIPVIPNNQIWYFHQIGSTNQYVVQNERSGKVLEAENPETRNTDVRQSDYNRGDKSQIWVLEKEN